MPGAEYWFLKCKICSHFHRGDAVNRSAPILNVPFDGTIECPNSPGQTASYQTRDWYPMTESQWQGLEQKNRDS